MQGTKNEGTKGRETVDPFVAGSALKSAERQHDCGSVMTLQMNEVP